jgi:hypothetical protein
MEFPFVFFSAFFILPILNRQFVYLRYPTTSSALRRTILQVNKHFILAVWTLQDGITNKKSISFAPLSISLQTQQYIKSAA